MDRDILIRPANTCSSFEEESSIMTSIQFNGEIINMMLLGLFMYEF